MLTVINAFRKIWKNYYVKIDAAGMVFKIKPHYPSVTSVSIAMVLYF